MIKSIVLAVAIIVSSTAMADVDSMCKKVGSFSVKVYDGKHGQNGVNKKVGLVAFDTISDIIRGQLMHDGQDFGLMIVHDAYTKNRRHSDYAINTGRVDFKSKWVMWCHETFNKNKWE